MFGCCPECENRPFCFPNSWSSKNAHSIFFTAAGSAFFVAILCLRWKLSPRPRNFANRISHCAGCCEHPHSYGVFPILVQKKYRCCPKLFAPPPPKNHLDFSPKKCLGGALNYFENWNRITSKKCHASDSLGVGGNRNFANSLGQHRYLFLLKNVETSRVRAFSFSSVLSFILFGPNVIWIVNISYIHCNTHTPR